MKLFYKVLVFIFVSLFHTASFSYLGLIQYYKLKNGKEFFLGFDAYRGYSDKQNYKQAATIIYALKKMSEKGFNKNFELSYEDPGVYDCDYLGTLRSLALFSDDNNPHSDDTFLKTLREHKEKIAQIPDDSFPAIVFPSPGLPFSALFKVKKSSPKESIDPHSTISFEHELSTFLVGKMTKLLAHVDKDYWPDNLKIRSNDPRRYHWSVFAKDVEWVKKNGKFLKVKDFIISSGRLKNRRLSFQCDHSLLDFPKTTTVLKDFFNEFKDLEEKELNDFKFITSLDDDDLNMSIKEFVETHNTADIIIDYLQDRTIDLFEEAPIVDILMSLFSKNSADVLFSVVGNHIAQNLQEIMDKMDIVEEEYKFDPTALLEVAIKSDD